MQITYEADHVVIRIPCAASTAKMAPLSKTGKSRMIANAGGFAPIPGAPDGVKVSLNLIGKV